MLRRPLVYGGHRLTAPAHSETFQHVLHADPVGLSSHVLTGKKPSRILRANLFDLANDLASKLHLLITDFEWLFIPSAFA